MTYNVLAIITLWLLGSYSMSISLKDFMKGRAEKIDRNANYISFEAIFGIGVGAMTTRLGTILMVSLWPLFITIKLIVDAVKPVKRS